MGLLYSGFRTPRLEVPKILHLPQAPRLSLHLAYKGRHLYRGWPEDVISSILPDRQP